jgi:hypothetical protein
MCCHYKCFNLLISDSIFVKYFTPYQKVAVGPFLSAAWDREDIGQDEADRNNFVHE